MKLFFAVAAFVAVPFVAAAERPAGYQALDCDPDMFKAVRSERTGEILYWNNRTCAVPEDGPTKEEIEELSEAAE